MSHQPERKEKDCLNCGAEVSGRFCHKCGQENIVPHQNFWSLTKHFIYDIFHFDGKFFDTLRLLLFKPGYVAKEYVSGKRVRFLDPIRMYLFTSAIFFLVFFSLEAEEIEFSKDYYWAMSMEERMEMAMMLSENLKKNPEDSIARRQLNNLLDSTKKIELFGFDGNDSSSLVRFQGKNYRMNATADTVSVFSTKSKVWWGRMLKEKNVAIEKKYKNNPMESGAVFVNGFLHRLPYLLFVSLPLFAAILKLLYRRRKHLVYSDHAVFTLYHYILSFIMMLLFILLDDLGEWIGWNILEWLAGALLFLLPVHFFLAIKRFYQQGFGRTVLKFILLNLAGFVLLILLFAVFLLLSLIQT